MTVAIFISLVAIFAIIDSFLTEGIKKWCENANKQYSANIIALVNAIILGCGGTSVAYLILDIPFTLVNIICIIGMTGITWLGAMLGYDKVKQLITQIITVNASKRK